MANLPPVSSKITDTEVDFQANLSEVLFTRLGSNINELIDRTTNLFGTGGIQIFTSSGTYNKPGLPFRGFFVLCVGGGGSGARRVSSGGTGGGGGGGGTTFAFIPSSEVGSSVSVTIGAGGTAPASGNTNGNSGGTTSFGSLVVANGGGGGPQSSNPWVAGGAGASAGSFSGTGSFGLALAGSPSPSNGTDRNGQIGAHGFLGSGGGRGGAAVNANGLDAIGRGAGGGGFGGVAVGGNGSAGVCIVVPIR